MKFEAKVIKRDGEYGAIILDEIVREMNLKEGEAVILTLLEKGESEEVVR